MSDNKRARWSSHSSVMEGDDISVRVDISGGSTNESVDLDGDDVDELAFYLKEKFPQKYSEKDVPDAVVCSWIKSLICETVEGFGML